jgi:hypothetical protein
MQTLTTFRMTVETAYGAMETTVHALSVEAAVDHLLGIYGYDAVVRVL